jgi:asparagine synthase (glutamine-hydrolysing)
VPAYLAFRKKDPAQSGSGIHGIIHAIAERRMTGHDRALSDKNVEADKGSLYRYGEPEYGDDLTRAFLQGIEEEIRQRFIPPFMTARANEVAGIHE